MNLRVRTTDATGWSYWNATTTDGLGFTTLKDVMNPNDGVTSLREAIANYQNLADAGALHPGLSVPFDPSVFRGP